MAINQLILEAVANPNDGELWYIAPTYRQAKNIAWRMLIAHYWKLPLQIRIQKNESELWVQIRNTRITLKGADNEDSLRGSGLDGLVLDEVDSYKNFKTLWEEVLRPTLTDKKGFCWFVGTPKGFFNLYDLSLKELVDTDYQSFRFTSYENPYLDIDEINKAREELTEDAFAQEYLGEFKKFTGLVYKEFSRDIHTINPFNIPIGWYRFGAMDFGFSNPTVHLWIAVDKDSNIYVYDEYYQSQQTTQFHANVIKAKWGATPIQAIWGDPSAEQDMMDYASMNVYIIPAVKVFEGEEKSWVRAGINRISQLLKVQQITGKPKIYIFKHCRHLIKEFETYQWIEKKQEILNEKDEPLKANDHALDALRYFVVSFFASKYIGDTYPIWP